MSLTDVVDNGFCVGCGSCINNSTVRMTLNDSGFIQIAKSQLSGLEGLSERSKLCPFSDDSRDEDELGQWLFGDNSHFDEKVGFYEKVFTGSVSDNSEKLTSSSGGLTSWLAIRLLEEDLVDAVVHVGENNENKEMFSYRVSRNVEEIRNKKNKKSRYYPVSYQHMVDFICSTNERLLFIGIPCFVKSVRLLQKEKHLTNIAYVFSLVCGHMKSSDFAESLAWQSGVPPSDLKSVDFRVKAEKRSSSDYDIEVISHDEQQAVRRRNKSLIAANWGYGFFKHKACDYCDDLGGELADATFGDAWLSKFDKDYLGTNIVIIRDLHLRQILEAAKGSEIKLFESSVQEFYQTQAGNYRHRRNGLKVRIENNRGWVPRKRLHLLSFSEGVKRSYLYRYRPFLSAKSIELHNRARSKKNLDYFMKKIMIYLYIYEFLLCGAKKFIKNRIKKI